VDYQYIGHRHYIEGLEMVGALGEEDRESWSVSRGTNTSFKGGRMLTLRDISPAPLRPRDSRHLDFTILARVRRFFNHVLSTGVAFLNGWTFHSQLGREAVAGYLAELFPSLTSIMCIPTVSVGDWKRVEEHLAVLRVRGNPSTKGGKRGIGWIPSGLFDEGWRWMKMMTRMSGG